MQKLTENIAKISHFNGYIGQGIEWWCLNLHRKFINNRFCACTVKMLLKMAVHGINCSTFDFQYGKSVDENDCNKTARVTLTDHVIPRMRTNSSTAFNTALYAMT